VTGREDEAYAKFSELLNKDFDDRRALYGLGKIYREAEHYGLAFNLFRICASFKTGPGPWNEMGLCQAETYDIDRALYCFRRALELAPKDKHALSNLALAHLLKCEPDKALQYAKACLEIDPNFEPVLHHQSYANLLLGRWKEGWEGHARILGKVKTRTERFYENHGRLLPKWNGGKGKAVLVYGEQGIGDEVSFASCLPDLEAISDFVVLDCDKRLEGLFTKSFPNIKVHGTRFKDPGEWIDDYALDAVVALGDLPRFFRNADTDFPGTPYLKAEPKQIEGVGPKIGIAWTGGLPNTGSIKRSLSLESLEPILRSCNATWVSLEYKDRHDEIQAFTKKTGIQIIEPKEARSQDYGETASLVAGLDLVISVCTAVVHLSGALGKEAWVLVPSKPRWFYGMDTDKSPWYKSVQLFRQRGEEDWDYPIKGIERLLKLRFGC